MSRLDNILEKSHIGCSLIDSDAHTKSRIISLFLELVGEPWPLGEVPVNIFKKQLRKKIKDL